MASDLSILIPELRQALVPFDGDARRAAAAAERAVDTLACGRALRRFILTAASAAAEVIATVERHSGTPPDDGELLALIRNPVRGTASPEAAAIAAARAGWIAGNRAALEHAAEQLSRVDRLQEDERRLDSGRIRFADFDAEFSGIDLRAAIDYAGGEAIQREARRG